MGRRIPEEIIDQVRRHFDIVDVVSEYVTIKRTGRSYVGLCPFHSEKTPSFSVLPDKQIYHCFGCGAGGNVLSFYMHVEAVSFIEGLEQLAKRAGISLPEQEDDLEDPAEVLRKKEMLRAYELSAKYYQYVLLNSEVGAEALRYLNHRGLSKTTIEQFRLGYAPQAWDFLLSFLKKRGFDEQLMLDAGLLSYSQGSNRFFDKFRNRIMFPIEDGQGHVIAFGGRIMSDKKDEPKYLNSPETLLFQKGRHLYNLHRARGTIRQTGRALLLEGYMDVIACSQAGLTNGVASLGTSLTPEQARLLKRNADEIILMYDGDEAGQKATHRSSQVLKDAGASAKVVLLPDRLDPDEFIKKYGSEALDRILKDSTMSVTTFKLTKLRERSQFSTQDGKVEFLNEAVQIISEVSSPMEQEAFLRPLAEEFQVSLESLHKEMHIHRNEQKTGDNPVKKWNTSINNSLGMSRTPTTLLRGNVLAERHLLSYMLLDSTVARQVQEQVADNFSLEEHTALAAYLYSFYSTHTVADPVLFLSTVDDETLVRLASALIVESETLDRRPGMVDMYIKSIHRFSTERRLKDIPKEMEEAQRLGDTERFMTLAREQIELRNLIG